jgi:pimeloyl-ACP methyl ester carboxylesterase
LLLSGAAERTVDVHGLPVRYFEADRRRAGGRAARAALVLLHGFGDSAETWARVMPGLACEFRVLAPDLIGSGRTPVPPEGMHFSTAVQYLDGFVRGLGVERAILVGNSLGGALAIRYAARYPQRVAHLFLLDSAGLHGEMKHLLPATREQARQLMEMVMGPIRYVPGFVLDDVIRLTREPAYQAALRSEERVDVSGHLPAISAPTTIIWGERDRLIPPRDGERLREGIRGSDLVMLPGVAHGPHVEAPRRVVSIVLGSLRNGSVNRGGGGDG